MLSFTFYMDAVYTLLTHLKHLRNQHAEAIY